MSYKAEVIADSSGEWVSNGLAFATEEEAHAYGRDLMGRWTLVREVRTVESDEPVNYRFNADTYRAEPIPTAELARQQRGGTFGTLENL
jgi:hypothetical protein